MASKNTKRAARVAAGAAILVATGDPVSAACTATGTGV